MYESLPVVFRLPRSHWSKDLNNYEFMPEVKAAVDSFIAGKTRSLIFTGKPGTGKTHLSVGLYRWAVSRVGPQRAMWVDFPEFALAVKRGYGQKIDRMEEFREATSFLALDDFLGRKLSIHETEHILSGAIQIAHSNNAQLVLSTNYTLVQISEMLTPHELDRITDGAIHLEFDGPSRRG